MNSRSPGRKSPRNRTVTSSSPESASACRNGRGSRLPKNEPACVMRKRSPRAYSSPAKSSKSQPFGIVTTGPAGDRPSVSVGDRLGRGDDRVRLPRDEMRDAGTGLLLRARAGALVRAVCMQRERVAQVGDPLRAGGPLDGGADQVHRSRRRCRQHDVDALAARDRDRLRDRGRVPRDVLVRQQQAPPDRRRPQQRELHPDRPCCSSAIRRPRGPM